jgi:hypothetical protein
MTARTGELTAKSATIVLQKKIDYWMMNITIVTWIDI